MKDIIGLIKGLLYLLPLLIVLTIPLGVVADTYESFITLTIINNGTTSYINYPLIVSVNNTDLVNWSYINSTGLDTRVSSTSSSLYSGLANNNVTFVIPSLVGQQTITEYYRLGYVPDRTGFEIVPGYGGYVSVLDSSSMEPWTQNYTLSWSGYLQQGSMVRPSPLFCKSSTNTTLSPVGSTGFYYTDSNQFQYLSGTVEASAGTPKFSFSPNANFTLTGVRVYMAGGAAGTVNLTKTYGGIPDSTAAGILTGSRPFTPSAAGEFVSITFWTPITVANGTIYGLYFPPQTNSIGTSTANPYSGGQCWTGANVSKPQVDVIFDLVHPDYSYPQIISNQNERLIVSTAVSDGIYTLNQTRSGTTTYFYSNGVSLGSSTSITVVNTTNSWYCAGGMYTSNVVETIEGVTKCLLQPNAITSSSIIVDSSGNSNYGTVSWGWNPSGISITIGGVTSATSYTMGTNTFSYDTINMVQPSGPNMYENITSTGTWLDGWIYKKGIVIQGIANSNLTSYGIEIILGESSGSTGGIIHLNGHAQADFDDVRFTSGDGLTLLPYDYDGTVGVAPNRLAYFVVQVPYIPKYPMGVPIIVYYGNPSAPDAHQVVAVGAAPIPALVPAGTAGKTSSAEAIYDPLGSGQQSPGAKLPVGEIMAEAARSLEWSTNTMYMVVQIITSVAMGFGAFVATGSLLGGAIFMVVMLGVAMTTGTFGWWLPLVIGLGLIMIIYLIRSL